MILQCSSSELNVEVCLLNGQTFRFKKIESDDKFPIIRGVAHNRAWEFQRLDEQRISYQVLARFGSAAESDDETVLRDYFQLNVDLLKLYARWSEKDTNFKKQLDSNFQHLTGIRVLRQDVLETFFAFICSSNNHVDRIKTMVNAISELYGNKVDVELDGQVHTFYNFPTLEQLFENRQSMEDGLKLRKFGYRAAWIVKAVEKLTELGGRTWLEELNDRPYKEASETLVKNFTGIGKKVADCICLMALEFNNVVPIDTHVFRITLNNYLPSLPKEYGKCNAKHFREIQDVWIERFGEYAGWCQLTLFTNELRAFQQKKPATRKRKS